MQHGLKSIGELSKISLHRCYGSEDLASWFFCESEVGSFGVDAVIGDHCEQAMPQLEGSE